MPRNLGNWTSEMWMVFASISETWLSTVPWGKGIWDTKCGYGIYRCALQLGYEMNCLRHTKRGVLLVLM